MSSFIFQNRNLTDAIMPQLNYKVRGYSNNVIGGPLSATVEAIGGRNALFDLIEALRCPVIIYDDLHNPRWWGFISSVTIYWDKVRYSVSIDKMCNKIAVAFTDSNLRYTTAYSSDTDSTTEYGTKEILLSRSEISETNALQLRDTELQRTKYPIPVIKFGGSGSNKAVIECRSWLDTLDWRYYTNLSGKESYETLGEGGREIGEDDRPIFAQSFQIASASGWDATEIWLHCYKYPGSVPPVDNLLATLHADNAGNPAAAVLATGTVAAANIDDQASWIKFVLSVSVTFSTSTTYWLKVARSGAVSATAYYMVDSNRDAGYPRGLSKVYNTNKSTWSEEGGRWGDMNFIIIGDLATTAQISTLITNIGEFFAGSVIENASGVNTNPYRNGDNTAYFELLKLLRTGTTNDRRLLCEVTKQRYLRVYEEPIKPTNILNAYKLNGAGQLIDPYGVKVEPAECPVGIWCALQDVVPSSVDVSKLANPSPFFVEEAEYNPDNNSYNIMRTRDQSNVFEIGGIEEG